MVSPTTETQAVYYLSQRYSKYQNIKERSMHQVVQRENYENCYECGSPLKKVRHARTSPKICYDCRGSRQSSAVHVRNIFKEIKKNAVVVTDPLEDVFVDDPRALKEQEPSFRRSTHR